MLSQDSNSLGTGTPNSLDPGHPIRRLVAARRARLTLHGAAGVALAEAQGAGPVADVHGRLSCGRGANQGRWRPAVRLRWATRR
jgi:hypothetical protein